MMAKKLILFSFMALIFGIPNTQAAKSSLLFIGDSQTAGPFGRLVYKHFSEEFSEIQVFGVGSSSPRHWSARKGEQNGDWLCKRKGRHNLEYQVPVRPKICQGPTELSIFESLLQKYSPNLVIFQFLGNSMGRSKKSIHDKISNLLGSLSGPQSCVFATSPPFYITLKDKNKIRATTQDHFIEAIGDRCQIIKGVTKETMNTFATQRNYYAGDKIHLSSTGSQKFLEHILDQIEIPEHLK